MPGGIYRAEKAKGRGTALAPLRGVGLEQPDIKVVAKREDPYVHTFKDDDTNNIYKQLSNLASAGGKAAGVAAAVAEEQGALNWEKTVAETDADPVGEALSTPRKDSPKTLLGRVFTSAYHAGFDRIDGDYLGGQAAGEYAAAAERLKNGTHEQLVAEFGKIREKYLGGMVSDEQKTAFLPKAAHAEENLLKHNLLQGVEKAHNTILEKAKTSVRTSVMAGLGAVLGQVTWYNKDTGETKVLTLPDLEHPDALAAFLEAAPELQDGIDEVMKKSFDDAHVTNQGALDKRETTGLVLGVARSIAENTNSPEFLNFVNIPNADGIAIVDYNDTSGPVMGTMDRAREQAFDGRWKNQQRSKMLRTQRITEDFHKGQTEWMINIANINKITNDTERQAAINKAENDIDIMVRKTDGIIGKEEYLPMRGMLKEMTEQDYHPKTTKETVILDLQERIGSGELTAKYVYSQRNKLDYTKFMHYMQRGSEVEHGKMTRNASEKAKVFGPAQRLHQWLGQNAAQLYDPKDVWGTGSIHSDGPEYLNRARNWMYIEGAGREERLGRALNHEESEQLIQDTLIAVPPKQEPSEKDMEATIQDMVKRGLIPAGLDSRAKYKAWYDENVDKFTPMQQFALGRRASLALKAYKDKEETAKPK